MGMWVGGHFVCVFFPRPRNSSPFPLYLELIQTLITGSAGKEQNDDWWNGIPMKTKIRTSHRQKLCVIFYMTWEIFYFIFFFTIAKLKFNSIYCQFCAARQISTCSNSFLFTYAVAYIPANNLQKKRNITVGVMITKPKKKKNTSVTSSRLTFNDITPSALYYFPSCCWNSTQFRGHFRESERRVTSFVLIVLFSSLIMNLSSTQKSQSILESICVDGEKNVFLFLIVKKWFSFLAKMDNVGISQCCEVGDQQQ